MTDKEKLQQFQEQLAANEYFRHNVIKDLLDAIDEETGKLNKELNIKKYERDDLFLFEVLMHKLDYKVLKNTEYYNAYFQCYCYKIQLG